MRQSAFHAPNQIAGLPRGWVVVGLAIVAWGMVALAWTGLSQLFGLVLASL